MTLISRDKQRQKLASPFRSPLLVRRDPSNLRTTEDAINRPVDFDRPSTPSREETKPQPSTLPRARPLTKFHSPLKNSMASTKASTQFKSPLMSSTSTKAPSRVNSSRQILDLERKLQLLKRAVKIKKDTDDDKLEKIVQKWKQVGREASWDLWQIVRENDEAGATCPNSSSAPSSAISSSWGWAGSSSVNNSRDSWGWDAVSDNKETADGHCEFESPIKLERELYASLSKPITVQRKSMLPPTPRGAYFEQQVENQHEQLEEVEPREEAQLENSDNPNNTKSLGTMLHQLGIAHETLGWSEEEGDFVDA